MVLKVLGFAAILVLAKAGDLEFGYPEAYAAYTSPVIAKFASPAISYQAPITSYSTPAISTYSSPILTKYAAHAPIISKAIVEEASPAAYDFEYAVDDPHTGDSKIHQESRRGDQVQGRYSLVEPDGTKRTVEYVADHNGFNAIVHKEPLNHGVAVASPAITKVATPLATYAPAAAYEYAPAPAIDKISSAIAGYTATPSFDYAVAPAVAKIGIPSYDYSGLSSLGYTNKIYTDARSIYSPSYAYHYCKKKNYPKLLPTTSIVIVFHNEAWSTLLRTVWSAINRSPRPLLKEIILVDDASERDYLGEQLEKYVKTLPVPVYVYRTEKRSGLIRARLLGAKHVKGDVITFLDAHCECTEGWLEPLLARIVENRKTVVCPIIDVISDESFEYITASDMTWGGFNWKLNFRWYRVPQREMDRRGGDRTAPLRTPTMAGGLFAIDKEYFYELGAYDEGMDIWGGENLEMSFRVWQCGGILEIIPCSHVGHVFRDKSPYTFPGGVSKIVLHNAARVAEVWMDEWRDFYYAMNPGARNVPVGDISARRELRDKLKCKSFRWYLETIYPESQMPLEYYYLGDIRNADTHNCLDTMGRKSGENLGITYCHNLGGNQVFAYTKRQQVMSDDNCLDASQKNGPVKLVRCHGMGGNQAWVYDDVSRVIRHENTGQCLQKPDVSDMNLPLLRHCDGSLGQEWIMQSEFKWQARRSDDR